MTRHSIGRALPVATLLVFGLASAGSALAHRDEGRYTGDRYRTYLTTAGFPATKRQEKVFVTAVAAEQERVNRGRSDRTKVMLNQHAGNGLSARLLSDVTRSLGHRPTDTELRAAARAYVKIVDRMNRPSGGGLTLFEYLEGEPGSRWRNQTRPLVSGAQRQKANQVYFRVLGALERALARP